MNDKVNRCSVNLSTLLGKAQLSCAPYDAAAAACCCCFYHLQLQLSMLSCKRYRCFNGVRLVDRYSSVQLRNAILLAVDCIHLYKPYILSSYIAIKVSNQNENERTAVMPKELQHTFHNCILRSTNSTKPYILPLGQHIICTVILFNHTD